MLEQMVVDLDNNLEVTFSKDRASVVITLPPHLEPYSYEDNMEFLNKDFPFCIYDDPIQMGEHIVTEIRKIAEILNCPVSDNTLKGVMNVFANAEYDTVEELILINKPILIMH